MRAAQLRSLCVSLAILCTGCSHKTSGTPQQAQAPPLQTGKGTLAPPKTTQQAEKTAALNVGARQPEPVVNPGKPHWRR